MSSVDSRIVQMKFDNSRFERGVAVTMGTLSKLKSALNFGQSKKSIESLQGTADNFKMGGMGAAVQGVSGKFLALATVAATALSNITNKAVDAGLTLAKSLTLDPIMDGFREYETKMGSIQTILSNTSRHGTTLGDVTKNLDQLNKYADKTIYSFSDMTRNIGLFTNAGIGIEDSTAMIKGFSNEAAASGTNSQGAASAAYQLSQALSAGTIRLMDWRSLQNVGMGNKNMQNGLIEIADAMGTFEGTSMNAKKASDNFNASLEEKWLTADVMENYLKIQAGELTKAQIKNLGLTDKQATAFLKQQKIAEDAATKVRTFTQLIGTLQEAAGSGWAETFDLVLGDFNAATELFTGVEQAIGGMLSRQAKARNKVIGGWAKLGGRDLVIEGMVNAFKGLLGVLKPIGEAFRDVFPRKTAQDLYEMSMKFRNFTKQLKMGADTSDALKRTFRGFFSVFSIGWQIIKGIAGVFARLFGVMFKGSGGFLELTGSIGDFFYGVDQGLKKGKGLTSFFDALFKALSGVGGAVGAAAKGIWKFFEEVGLFGAAGKALSAFWEIAKKALGGLGDLLGKAFSATSVEGFIGILQTGLLAGIFLQIKKFFKNLGEKDLTGGIIDTIKESFGQLTDTLKAMQTQLQAKSLMTMAIAVGLLAASLVALSMIDGDKLTKALSAIAVGFGQLVGAMALMAKVGGSLALVSQLSLMSVAMVILAGAMLVLSAAMKVMSTMSWEELAKGLIGVAGAIGIFALAGKLLSKGALGMAVASVGILALAVAMNLLAVAMKMFATMSIGDMAKSLIMLAGSLTIIATAVRMMPKSIILIAPALVAIAVAMNLLALALAAFGSMDIVSMVTGLTALGGSLAIIAGALRLMPKNMLAMGVGLLAVGVALNGIAIAMKIFGSMSIGEMAKSLIMLGASLAILAIGLSAMSGTLMGSAGLLLAAAAISVLVPPLLMLGNMSIGEIAKSLIALALALTILGVAGYLINAASLAIVALGAGLLLLGAGFALAGAGAALFASAFASIVETMREGQSVIMGALKTIGEFIVAVFVGLAKGLVAFVVQIANAIPSLMEAMGKLLGAIISVIVEYIPKIAEMMGKLVMSILNFLRTQVPQFIIVGFELLTAFLSGLASNIGSITASVSRIIITFMTSLAQYMPQIVTAGANLLIKFMQGLSNNMFRVITAGVSVILKFLAGLNAHMPRLITAGMTVIVSVLNGIAQNIGRLVTAGTNIIVKLLNGIANNMPRIVTAGTNIILKMMGAIASNLWRVINMGTSIIIKLLNGIANKMSKVVDAGTRVVTKFIGAIGRGLWKITNVGANMILKILNGMAKKMPQIVKAGADVIVNTLNGITRNLPRIIRAGANVIIAFLNGLNREMPRITNAAYKTLIAFINGLTDAINRNQGKLNRAAQRLALAIINGMVWGLKWNAGKVGDAALKVAKDSLKGAKNWLGINSPSKRFRDEIGKPIPEGMADGIYDDGYRVEDATKYVAKSALKTAKDAISKVGASLEGDADMDPVIRPVLDLSGIRKDAKLIDGIAGGRTIKADASYSGAAAAIREQRVASEASAAATTQDAVARKIEFNQYNTSPKALSDIDIYRQTNNQLSAAKGALTV